MAIDVGNSCIDRGLYYSAWRTIITDQNPSDADGTIDSVCIYAQTGNSIAGIEYAAFIDEGSNTFSTNGDTNGSDLSATGGTATTHTSAGGDFTAFAIDTGEYIGFYATSGRIEATYDEYSGKKMWNVYETDSLPCSSVDFGSPVEYIPSLYATGEESGSTLLPIFGNGNIQNKITTNNTLLRR